MKRFISILLAFILILSCAACGKKIEEKIGYTSEASEEVYKNEYKDSNGDVSSTLEYHYPVLKGLSEDVSNAINDTFKEKIADKEHGLEINVDNVTAYIKNLNLEGPQVTIVEFEEYYVDDYVASFIMKERTGTNPDEVEPIYEGISFSLSTGEQLSVSRLALPEKDEETNSLIEERIISEANLSYSSNTTAISEETEENIRTFYDGDNFVTNGYNLAFVYNYSDISNGEKSGIYICDVDVSDMGEYIICPADYGQS